ncbi:GCN5-related N-acetyltransferase [Clostridium sp. DL-VIII]|uniref:GNAT family N-acetyltransferase n=1 Tax=Clostridium sp. DL-VIII TaxID=641107 RepID=UPI00023AFCE4|nr:GNAT family N-acetyltransferase [Clostridium sp. DL-VIII]EHI99571.1 GCN5-related N-acetyltransferase [Clostridium sp. DL-VIII]
MKQIETERLTIRRFKGDDWKDFYEYVSNEEVLKFEPYKPFSEEETKNEAIRRTTDPAFWAVCLEENNKLIGNIYFAEGNFNTWEIGYVFNLNYWGNGYATESCKALMNYAFKDLKVRRIIAKCDPTNLNSWTVLERLTMRREGHLKESVYFFKDENDNPIWKDTYEYGILKKEWLYF